MTTIRKQIKRATSRRAAILIGIASCNALECRIDAEDAHERDMIEIENTYCMIEREMWDEEREMARELGLVDCGRKRLR